MTRLLRRGDDECAIIWSECFGEVLLPRGDSCDGGAVARELVRPVWRPQHHLNERDVLIRSARRRVHDQIVELAPLHP